MRSVRQAGEDGSGWRDEAFLRFRLYPSLSAEELQRMADTPMGAAVGIEEVREEGRGGSRCRVMLSVRLCGCVDVCGAGAGDGPDGGDRGALPHVTGRLGLGESRGDRATRRRWYKANQAGASALISAHDRSRCTILSAADVTHFTWFPLYNYQVRGADLLTAGIGRGEVLHGFHEPPITFPPSFKW